MSKAPPAARTLQRRIRARQLYRRRRDRKIAVDWLGRDFVYSYTDPLGRRGSMRLTVCGYNPETYTVVLRTEGAKHGNVVWDTDRFWEELRRARLVYA